MKKTVRPSRGSSKEQVSLIPGHLPAAGEVESTLGQYQILKSIGRGGMGEVFLAYDTNCGRRIALKKIRPDLTAHKLLHRRFLKEARITSQLTHPAIIPIYTIQCENNLVYYTMPYVEGKTLKQILRATRGQKERSCASEGSISSLMRIFTTVCHAIAYAHAKGVLHRDVKPENIMIGRYGEVYILDWGLVKLMEAIETSKDSPKVKVKPAEATLCGKIVGTLSHMAPERARGEPASVSSEIYALGSILYQILTLHLPFHRKSLKEFQKNMDKEVLEDPSEVAPYRSVPKALTTIVTKCLSPKKEDRYLTVDALIQEVENYLEGRSEWFPAACLDIADKSCWEFQENILLTEHIAITRTANLSEWVNFMVSKESFLGNTKVEARVKIHPEGNGVGFLLSIPEASERRQIHDAYCLWLGSEGNRTTKLLRSNIEVLQRPEIFLEKERWYQVKIEKVDNNVYFYLDGILQFSYISYLPLSGTHVGLLAYDNDFSIENFSVSVGGQHVTVNCLAIPDAFLAHKDYQKALIEYRRIGYSFPGRDEGREALFRAGVTLLEQARTEKKEEVYDLALAEFEKLHNTPGVPLEYLGKALVYQVLEENEEEAKCFELALRRYPNHPLQPILQEQIVYRVQESAHSNRTAAYRFLLLAVRHLSSLGDRPAMQKLIANLEKNWEPLPFIEPISLSEEEVQTNMAIQLAFWLAKPRILAEIVEKCLKQSPLPSALIANALSCLIEIGSLHLVEALLAKLPPNDAWIPLYILTGAAKEPFEEIVRKHKHQLKSLLPFSLERLFLQWTELVLARNEPKPVPVLSALYQNLPLTEETKKTLGRREIWALLLANKWEEAGARLNEYPSSVLQKQFTPFYFLYGCWLLHEKPSKAQAHFSRKKFSTIPYPIWGLSTLWLQRKEKENEKWLEFAFLWEKKQLFQQLALYYHCSGEKALSQTYQTLAEEQTIETD